MRAVGPPWVKPEELAPIDSDPGNVLGNVLAGPPYFMDGLWPVGHPERAREEARLAGQRGAERTRLEREALGWADTYAPGPPCGTYGLRVPASCVPYVPEAQGSLPQGQALLYVRRTRTSLGLAVRTMYHGTTGSSPSTLVHRLASPTKACSS